MNNDDIVVVCVPTTERTPFDDNKRGICCRCSCEVWYRPFMPENARKVCLACLPHLEDEEGPADGFAIHPKSLPELEALGLLKKKPD